LFEKYITHGTMEEWLRSEEKMYVSGSLIWKALVFDKYILGWGV